MFLNPDFPASQALRLARSYLLGSVAATVLVGGCAGANSKSRDEATVTTVTPAAPSVATIPAPSQPAVAAAGPVAALPAAPAQAADAVAPMLAYAERVRLMPPAELSQEVARLGDGSGPVEQLQLALVLSQLHQLPELLRAQELLGRVLANADAQAQPLHALARLLAARYGELRRLEELLEKQTQQTREVQRRLDQTNERLEALKAIERSLRTRPPAAGASAPASRALPIPAP